MNDTTAKTILLTGASGKLGRQMASHFSAAGHTVIAVGRTLSNLETLACSCPGPGTIKTIQCNLATDGTGPLIASLLAADLHPNYLVNNAFDMANQAYLGPQSPTREQWSTEFELAVMIPHELTMSLAAMPSSALSSVVNIASMYGIVARNPHLYDDPELQSPIHYGVAKAAMIFLTKELAVRLAPRGIRVNAVSFGGVEGRVDQAFKDRYAKLSPSGRMLQDKEVPHSVAFLLSEAAVSITGQNLQVDGGWTLW